MSNNSYARGGQSMNIKDLHEGQVLVRVSTPRWRTDEITTTRWVIKKVLKTRLVIAREDRPQVEVRIIVRFSKPYPYRNGEVTTAYEGQPTYALDHYSLYTEDDPALEEFAARASKAAAKTAAIKAAEALLKALKDGDVISEHISHLVEYNDYLAENAK